MTIELSPRQKELLEYEKKKKAAKKFQLNVMLGFGGLIAIILIVHVGWAVGLFFLLGYFAIHALSFSVTYALGHNAGYDQAEGEWSDV